MEWLSKRIVRSVRRCFHTTRIVQRNTADVNVILIAVLRMATNALSAVSQRVFVSVLVGVTKIIGTSTDTRSLRKNGIGTKKSHLSTNSEENVVLVATRTSDYWTSIILTEAKNVVQSLPTLGVFVLKSGVKTRLTLNFCVPIATAYTLGSKWAMAPTVSQIARDRLSAQATPMF